MEFPKRKINRLTDFDYDTPNAYFITICVQSRKRLFWANANGVINRPDDVVLSQIGKYVDCAICQIPQHYPRVSVDHYAIMPDHVHLLLQIHSAEQSVGATIGRPEVPSRSEDNGRPMAAPTIARVINQFKGTVTKQVGFSIWQKGFYDHVVRNDADYREIWEYIENNPMRWEEDKLYII